VGEVDYDETRLSKITTRTAGWLNEVWADTKWMKVEEGQKLAELYSPELYSAQKEYLLAKGELRATAAQRLRLLGIGNAEIATLERTGKVRDFLILRAPRTGVVAERHATKGAAVKKGETLYAIADLSHVWIQADVFESDLPFVSVGQTVRIEALNRKRPIMGTVAFIDPALDRHTRTARMRVEIKNDGLRLGQRVDAWIDTEVEGKPLTLPRTAVLSTGERSIVYVLFTEQGGEKDYDLDPADLPGTVFYEMVSVRVGPTAANKGRAFYPLLEGELKAGMVIVTKGNLLLDSQAQLLGKPSLLFPKGSRSGAADMHMGH
jgi:Cu(I)/Ag(I) efflux system membrane fusion protein